MKRLLPLLLVVTAACNSFLNNPPPPPPPPGSPTLALVDSFVDRVYLTAAPADSHRLFVVEQAGRRPALVLSPAAYNGRVGLALLCPITSQVKGYPFEVPIPAGSPVRGVVGADQVKSLDWRARNAAHICTIPVEVVDRVLERLQTLLAG